MLKPVRTVKKKPHCDFSWRKLVTSYSATLLNLQSEFPELNVTCYQDRCQKKHRASTYVHERVCKESISLWPQRPCTPSVGCRSTHTEHTPPHPPTQNNCFSDSNNSFLTKNLSARAELTYIWPDLSLLHWEDGGLVSGSLEKLLIYTCMNRAEGSMNTISSMQM